MKWKVDSFRYTAWNQSCNHGIFLTAPRNQKIEALESKARSSGPLGMSGGGAWSCTSNACVGEKLLMGLGMRGV